MSLNDEQLRAAIRQAQYKYSKEHRQPDPKQPERVRNWQRQHPEKVKEYEQRFYLRKAIEYGLISADDAEMFDSTIKNKAVYRYKKEKGII